MTPKMAVISCGRWYFGKPAKKKEKPKLLTTFAFGHPRRSTIDMLVLAIPGEREQATKQVVFDAVHKKPPVRRIPQAHDPQANLRDRLGRHDRDSGRFGQAQQGKAVEQLTGDQSAERHQTT